MVEGKAQREQSAQQARRVCGIRLGTDYRESKGNLSVPFFRQPQASIVLLKQESSSLLFDNEEWISGECGFGAGLTRPWGKIVQGQISCSSRK